MTWEATYHMWQDFTDLDAEMKEDLDRMADDEEALEDAFYQPLKFGTAGMRGVIGAGINRMNIYTVRQATEGLAQLITSYGEEAKQRGVAIAYDSRHYSPEFALEAAKTLGAHGIKAYLFSSLRPTPELSFAVRELHAISGIMVTASHNPPEYNGYKVYGEDGGQMPPEAADQLTEYVTAIESPLTIEVADEEELKAQELLEIIDEAVDAKYLEAVKGVTVRPEIIAEQADNLKIVYTPLHGTGQMLVERTLANAGFKHPIFVDEQKEPDANFSTVQSPNPEESGAFEVAEKYGRAYDADLLIATDPDADRMGASVRRPDGSYQVITGNQIAALMTHYILTAKQSQNDLPTDGVIMKSIVSSEMAATIAKDFDIETIDVLTGFKFIAEKIHQFEQDHSHTFLFGFEESYGYLVEPFVRDKDAVQATVLLAEVAAYYQAQGQTIYDGLQQLYATYGYFLERTVSIKMDGQSGQAKIKALMDDLRANPLTQLAETSVVMSEDYDSLERRHDNGDVEKMAFDQANVLKYYLADNSWFAIRPSGTEPKIKCYVGVVSDTADESRAKVDRYEEAIAQLLAE